MSNFNIAIVEAEIDRLLVLYPELADDENLRADMIEGSTSAFDAIRTAYRRSLDANIMIDGLKA